MLKQVQSMGLETSNPCREVVQLNATIYAIKNIPLIKPADDIASIICEKTELNEYDIIVISSTIVSKSENRIRSLKDVKVTKKAEEIAKRNDNIPEFVQTVLNECKEVILESPFLLTRTKSGSVCVNAGIDASNVEGFDNIILLPEFPDKSAEKIKNAIFKYSGKKVSVIISDTNGRAFRIGQTGTAIGISGIKTTKDWRGTEDLFGRKLEVKNEAIVDEIAGFANIFMGEGNGGTPVVVISGLSVYDESSNISEIYRPESEDVIIKYLKSQSKH